MADEKNIYVELSIRAIKDGRVWQEGVERYPGQSKMSYLAIEEALTKALLKLGHDAASLKGDKSPDQVEPRR